MSLNASPANGRRRVRDRGALDEEQVAGVDTTADVGAELTNAGAELAADQASRRPAVGAGAVAEVDLDAVADVAGGGAGGVETGVADREAAEVGVALALVERADGADLHAAIFEARHAGGESLDVLVELGPVALATAVPVRVSAAALKTNFIGDSTGWWSED